MRLRPSYAIAAAIALVLTGWLLSGRLGADDARRAAGAAAHAAAAAKPAARGAGAHGERGAGRQ